MRTDGASPAKPKISRFPYKERAHMPGSQTTPYRANARVGTSDRVAFHVKDRVGVRNRKPGTSFAGPSSSLQT